MVTFISCGNLKNGQWEIIHKKCVATDWLLANLGFKTHNKAPILVEIYFILKTGIIWLLNPKKS